MENNQIIHLLNGILTEVAEPNSYTASERFAGLREVDSKVRETKMILGGASGLPPTLMSQMEVDIDFQANSRRVRLEALAGYIRNALKVLNAGGMSNPKKQILAPPDFSKLTVTMPGLDKVIEGRWREAQKCQHVQAYTASVILMGSILEALLLCRGSLAISEAYQSPKAPKNKDGKIPAIHDWNLNFLIEVATDRGWLKSDRGKFGHALRESRNVVHPWVEVTTRANFDEATCRTSWEVLLASVNDLLGSV